FIQAEDGIRDRNVTGVQTCALPIFIDEIGYLPIDPEDAKLFFQLIDMRYEKRSTIFTTNINFKSWDEVFQEPKLANAILDRILHHATVVTIVGDSYRLKDHLAKDSE